MREWKCCHHRLIGTGIKFRDHRCRTGLTFDRNEFPPWTSHKHSVNWKAIAIAVARNIGQVNDMRTNSIRRACESIRPGRKKWKAGGVTGPSVLGSAMEVEVVATLMRQRCTDQSHFRQNRKDRWPGFKSDSGNAINR
jgi:hypothetical protein